MVESKVVVWSSDEGRVKTEVVRTTGKRKSALTALQEAHAFMTPFIKKLSQNTGDARIVIVVEYAEQDRAAAPPADSPATEYEMCFDPNKRHLPHEPFRPKPNAYVRHATDLPCPTCGVPVNVACLPKGDLYVGTGNGLTEDNPDQIMRCHRTRYDLFQVYINLFGVEGKAPDAT